MKLWNLKHCGNTSSSQIIPGSQCQHKAPSGSDKGTIATPAVSSFGESDYSSCARMHLDCYLPWAQSAACWKLQSALAGQSTHKAGGNSILLYRIHGALGLLANGQSSQSSRVSQSHIKMAKLAFGWAVTWSSLISSSPEKSRIS